VIDEELDREYGFPVKGVVAGEPIPDLRRIPRERWPEMLGQLSDRAGRLATSGMTSQEEMVAAMEAWLAAWKPTKRALPPRLPPAPARRPPRRARQVNVRLYARDAEALADAARLAGATPTELARWFIVSGSRRMVDENRAQTVARTSSA
jgi:hypothetical protein